MKKTILILFALFFLIQSPAQAATDTDKFLDEVKDKVRDTPELSKSRKDIFRVISLIKKDGVYSSRAQDEAKRAVFVGLQSAIEQVLSEKKQVDTNFKMVMAIHTPTPATPLCTEVSELSQGLVSDRLKNDNQVGHTILSRAEILQTLLQQKTPLYVVYSKNGLAKRTPEQQSIYLSRVKKYQEHLVNLELSSPEMSGDMIGATYLMTLGNEEVVFFIKATQANKPGDDEWQIGFGPADQADIHQRVSSVLNYLKNNGQPKVKKAFEDFGW